MEKTFQRYLRSKAARDAFIEAEVATRIAHQIRVIRKSRGWTQAELARKLGTTQTAVCRMEDAEYGRLTLKSLYQLASVFDTGLEVGFRSFVSMLTDSMQVRQEDLGVEAFEVEAASVGFEAIGTVLVGKSASRTDDTYTVSVSVVSHNVVHEILQTSVSHGSWIADAVKRNEK